MDAFTDFAGNLITAVPRLRMAVRGGEIAKGKILKDPEIIETIRRLIELLKPIGLSTIQLIRTRRGIEFLEINPRFGGGAPMSIHSGADFCEYLYRLLRGESLSYREDYLDNITFLRFDSSICINDDLEVLPLQSDQ